MNILLLSLFFFTLGAVCVYVPFKKLKNRISDLLQKVSLLSEDVTPLYTVADLNQYIENMKLKIKESKEQQVFYQKKLEAITSSTKEAIIILDKYGKLIFHNSQSHKLFYIEESKSSQYLNEMIRSPDVMEVFRQCLKTNTQITKQCMFGPKNQYIKSSFEVIALPISDEKTRKPNVILLFYDLTAIKESQKAHVDFVSNVSHELKTPLTSIQGYVEMLVHNFKNKKFDQLENFSQVLLRNCKRMSRLVDELLRLSNLISQAGLEKKKLNTKEVTEEVVARIDTSRRHLHFTFSASYVMANPTWVEVVLHNLIDNACCHTPENSDVYIRWEEGEGKVLLKVADSGEGISEKYQDRIFERFFKIDPARSREKGGTGVGLALVKQSMEKHGGRVRAVSPAQGGTEFICEFPSSL